MLPICKHCEIDTCLIGRAGKQEHNSYILHWESGDPEVRDVRWACGPLSLAELDPEGADRIHDPGSALLITATLRNAISDRRPLLDEIVQARRDCGAAETTVVACENALPRDWHDIRTTYAEVASFPATVIDRVARCPDDELDKYAAYPIELGLPDRASAPSDGRGIGLPVPHRDTAGYTFGVDRLRVYTDVNDKVSRVVGKYKRHDLAPYLADLQTRVFGPAGVLASKLRRAASPWANGAMEPFQVMLDFVDALLENVYLAEDWEHVDVGTLSDQADADAVSAYAHLARSCLPPDAAERRIRAIRELLRDHREAYQA
ncbi:MAG: hypothetical protein ABW167_05065 [Baekduia sp.]